ncbi:phospholipase-like protein [Tanacetum coccineum]|uniref:Phospholipase-like protein n=1 Tax=Tanacetum coccineum TaxID=301880 RepID=A0ABQ4Z4R9_9ASTR
MILEDYEEHRVLVTCRSRLGWQIKLLSDETYIVLLYYHIVDNFQIQFGREEFCLVTGLRFGVEYWADYNNEDDPIPFRRRVFSSAKDGKPIIGKMVEKLITSELFYRLHDDDAVSLCCVGILQFVLLGFEDRRGVPDWILRLANDRDGWDKYHWGSYVLPTLYSQLRDANVRLWPNLYATEPRRDVDQKKYSIFGFTWAFKVYVDIGVVPVGENDYYKSHRRYPRIGASSSKKKFYRHMIRDFFHGRLPTERLTPDENEAPLDWWVSSRAYFDGRISEVDRVPRHLNRQNHYEVPSELYREIEEQKRAVDHMLKKEKEREKIMYMRTPYMDLPPTIVLPKKHGDKTKGKNSNVSPLNLGNAFADDDVGEDEVVIIAKHVTGNYFVYENVDPSKEAIALVARMEAIRIFLAFATYMNFIVFLMDVKSVFLNSKLKEEIYVKQPPCFESIEFPDYVCKLDKALYKMKQAPKTWFKVRPGRSMGLSEEWNTSNPEFRALFILEDGALVARIWGVKGCTIIAFIYDLAVTAGEVRRTKIIVHRTLTSIINSSLDFLLDSSYNDR